MPELPEVETIRMGLEKYLVGHKIEDVEVKVAKLFQGDKKNIIGAKFKEIKRAGKGLIIDLDNGYSIAIHIKLTGQIIYRGVSRVSGVPKVSREEIRKLSERVGGELPNKQTHIIFKLDKNSFLYYNDLRRFGWVKIVKTEGVGNLPFFKELGPEPPVVKVDKAEKVEEVEKGKVLTFEKFKEILSKSKTAIKPLLMDQKKIGGIGNIYANDGLFDARIDPRRKASSLSKDEIKNLFNSLIRVLKRGLKYGGSSEINFVNALGEEGSYQDHALIYGREGEKCLGCSGKVQKIYLGGRGTYFCPNCQK